jgi:hypothetical protein
MGAAGLPREESTGSTGSTGLVAALDAGLRREGSTGSTGLVAVMGAALRRGIYRIRRSQGSLWDTVMVRVGVWVRLGCVHRLGTLTCGNQCSAVN